ncbi:MAG: TadE/TadG family type IV pilus assembly protein [Methylocystis sp.]|jgi:pilus assembly protein Flp/PilA
MKAKLTNQSRRVLASDAATGAIRRFAEDKSGATIVEFAMVAGPLLFMIIGVIEISLGNFNQTRMDAAVQSTARLIMTGVVQNTTQANGQPLTAQQFRDQVLCPRLPVTMSCNDVYVDVEVFAEPTSNASPSPYSQFVNASGTGLVTPALDNTKNNYCIGQGASYVVVDVVYPMPLIAAGYLLPESMNYNGRASRLLQSTATFKNEPFTMKSTSAGC